MAHWRDWLAAGTELSRQIRERRGGEYLAVDDGFYLALAQGLGCEFWTVDRHLHAAAKADWIRLPDAAA